MWCPISVINISFRPDIYDLIWSNQIFWNKTFLLLFILRYNIIIIDIIIRDLNEINYFCCRWNLHKVGRDHKSNNLLINTWIIRACRLLSFVFLWNVNFLSDDLCNEFYSHGNIIKFITFQFVAISML